MREEEREALRAALAALGFDVVRFAALARVPSRDFRAWMEAGHHAEMGWLERGAPRRLDPQLVLPGARTLIALGVNYRPGVAQSRWAGYALHRDYHDTIGRGLDEAVALLAARHGIGRDDSRAYTDTGPLLERGWAAVAGLGWQGKNGMLVSREHGNWLFLAAILTRLEVPADAPLRTGAAPAGEAGTVEGSGPEADGGPASTWPRLGEYCGTCTRCLAACPTQAFPRPGWVDARRCISYHTIENRGIVPRELRAGFGPRVFGCDVCLDVCPWNRFAQEARSRLVEARPELARLSLLDLLGMDEARFREVFRGSAIKRTKLTGLLRNACIAAGNWHDSPDWHFGGAEDGAAVVGTVERLCRHASEIVRAHAVWALFRLLGRDAVRARLAEMRAAEASPAVLAEFAAWD